MTNTERTRSPHMKLQEFVECFLGTDHKKELETFSSPRLTGPIREEVADEALRYLAVLLLYGIDERAGDISIIRKRPDAAVCRMSGDRFYDVPAPREEIVVSLFDELEEMAGMGETKRVGKLIVGIGNDEIELNISSTVTDEGEEKIMIQLPRLA